MIQQNNANNPCVVRINNVDYLTFSSAADLLQISFSTLDREINKKKIRCLKHPKGRLFAKEWLDEWIERRVASIRR